MKLIYSLPRNGKKLTGWKYKNAVKFISFCELYDYWNLYNQQILNSCFYESRLISLDTLVYNFENPSFHVSDYLDPDLIDSVYIPRLIDMNNDWERGLIEKELLPIGANSYNQYLLLGVGENNADKIYYESRSEDKIELLADNIFEYFTKIEVVAETCYAVRDLNKLYKNWGENFWRIREEGDSTKLIESKSQDIANITTERDKFYYKLCNYAKELKQNGKSVDEIIEKTGLTSPEIEAIKL